MLKQVEVKVLDSRLKTDFELPKFQTTGSAGMDLLAMPETKITLKAGETQLIPTGLAVHVCDPGFAAMILPRSGLGHKQGIVLGNLVGLIDSDYQGPLMVSAWNRGEQDFEIEVGIRLAQLIFVPVMQPELIEVSEFSDATQRGAGGFGSTGV